MSGPEFPAGMEKRKGVRIAPRDEVYTAKTYTSFQNKQMRDLRVFGDPNDGHPCLSTCLSDRQNPACLYQSFSRLLEEHVARHSNECGQSSFPANTDIHDVVLRHRNARTGSLSPSLASNFFSSNPIYVSGLTSSLSNKMNVDVTQNLVDENMRFPAVKHVLKLSKQKHLPVSIEISDQQRQLCRASNMGTLRNESQEDLVACEDLRHDQHCSILQEASSVAFRMLHSCCNCSCGVAENLSGKACTAGTNRICNQTSCIHDTKLYSKETHVKPSSCHLYNDDEQSVLRFFRTDDQIIGFAEHEMFSQKGGNGYIPGKCIYSVHIKCLKGCQLYKGEGPNSFKEHGVCGKNCTLAPAYDIEQPSQDGRRTSLGQFDGSRHVIVNGDCQSAFGRDVPSRALGNSDSIIIQITTEMLPTAGTIDYQLTENGAKDFDGTCKETNSIKEHRISSLYSACSAPVITEISVEENKLESCTGDAGSARLLFDPVIDEGSVIEKCGSSDDVIDNARSDEANF